MATRSDPRTGEGATRTRLLEAAMGLLAERGYDRMTVGEVERAAGLAPRSGALYQYFSGKEELLHEALAHEMRSLEELSSVLEMLPLGDVRAELTLLARWNLGSLDRRARLARFLARDVDRLPRELVDRLYEEQVAKPYAQIVGWLRNQLPGGDVEGVDVDALAVLFIESMAGYRAQRATFGRTPGDVDDERFVEAWVDVALAAAAAALARAGAAD
ncbi:MAG TPA: helix-turn-helix domain-containing protein [Solirubrobacteraceae bacterium]|nr:helix-turn-helix domain-containing protein [Solirubrobacteraceae bacterium]